MKALFLIDTLEIGGTERSWLEILSRFRTILPTVCHLYPGARLKSEFEAEGIQVVSLNIPGKYGFARAIPAVRQVVSDQQPQLIHTALFRSDVVGRIAGKLAGVPVVSSFVNEPYSALRYADLSPVGRTKLRLAQTVDALTAQLSTAYVSVSQSSKVENCRHLGIPQSRVNVVYRGRTPQVLTEKHPDQVEELRKALGIEPVQPILLNTGRLLYRKGQQDLLTAMPEVLRHFPDCRLLIAGEGPFRAQLEATIRELKLETSVTLLGARRDIPNLLHLADVFVFPSHYEGHPGALVEAMMAGKPIVASNIGVHGEMVTHGKSALLVETQNPQALAAGIVQMLRQPLVAEQMGCRAQENALASFQIEDIAQEYEQLLIDVARFGRIE